jgi:hypothetical protein
MMSDTAKSETGAQLQQAYKKYLDFCRSMHLDTLSYPEFLESCIDEIRGMAEPLAYAIRTSPPRDTKDSDIVQVGGIHEKARWLDGEPEIPLEVDYLKKLLYTIFDDRPELKIPDYDA